MIEAAKILIFPALMAFAASSDLFTMTISNRISLLLLASFCVLAFVIGMDAREIGYHFLAGALVLVVSFGFYARGWIGGGDRAVVRIRVAASLSSVGVDFWRRADACNPPVPAPPGAAHAHSPAVG